MMQQSHVASTVRCTYIMATTAVPKLWRIGGVFVTTMAPFYIYRRAYCSSTVTNKTPSLVLYQYQTCPFCCKTRAFLNYYGLQYQIVEVNPLSRKEIKFSKYKKVPLLTAGDVQVNDSSLIASVLRSSMILGKPVSRVLNMYPEIEFYDATNKTPVKERANKYFLMYGERSTPPLNELREEREWREWVDTHLVHTFSPNIYRTLRESWQAFQYISEVGNFNPLERAAARYFGTIMMYFIGKRIKKKYRLKEDVRQSLYDECNKWTAAIGKNRRYMGGDKPNLADLSVYGALTALEGLDTFDDMMKNTSIKKWYGSMKQCVDGHEGATDKQ
ncbi:PREDICTED: prostaglandin E synthase 2-like isoform X1 [Amphimedon queenslandica]|uniref:Prostaglandin E synthase 2 n=1 Tax=Amphimedon queenslandica TaxID=400682 RepID=A0A1X7TA78_AMPQE|nr:PREDICTED: prostaglandin E synthase 2-like isoform X1 [Amphimedon queenslandica]|eukprot:XP_011407993.2 PREDICTED: prostaglandin E synthase 2-like isoform X1 [Amphimedon queenslandica]